MTSLLGTAVTNDAPLMTVGLDSISATELTRELSEQIHTELPSTLLFDHPSVGAITSYVSEFNQEKPPIEDSLRCAPVHSQPDTTVVVPKRGPSARCITESIQTSLAEIIGTVVSSEAPLMTAGVDSISSVEFTRSLGEKFDTEFPATLLFDHPTVSSLVAWMETEVGGAPVSTAASHARVSVSDTGIIPPLMMPSVIKPGKPSSALSSESVAITLPGKLLGLASL